MQTDIFLRNLKISAPLTAFYIQVLQFDDNKNR